MEIVGGEEEGFVREWAPCTHMLSIIPPRVQTGLFSTELYLTCIDAVSDYIALGTNIGLVYWYDRKKGNIQRLRCEATTSPITFVKIVNTVDYMVGAGNAAGQVTVFQIPKEHPENVPEHFKPKVEPKVERYTIGDLHKSSITAIEWSKNGMRLFSGDVNGVIIMTEIDFYMHLCKSVEIVNEGHSIVQMSSWQHTLLVSSVYRTILCERTDSGWKVRQVGKKERKGLWALGGAVSHSYGGGGARVFCARAGLRLWRADLAGDVKQTLLFKEAINNPLTIAELLNPCQRKDGRPEPSFGQVHVFKEHFLVTYDGWSLFVLDPRSLTAVAVVDQLRKILSVSVNKDEIFVLEGPRSVLRLGHAPEPATHAETSNLMSKSLSSSLQQAVSSVREQTAPFISSVLEQPISLLTRHHYVETGTEANGDESFDLPPVKQLPDDISGEVLQSIVNEFRDVSDPSYDVMNNLKSEEFERKLKLYSSMVERHKQGELIHSRRSRRREGGGGSPRRGTPVRGGGAVTTAPCLMDVSVYGNIPQENDDVLEKQIEEKEKILAKMLNLESLSIDMTQSIDTTNIDEHEKEDSVFAPREKLEEKAVINEIKNKESKIELNNSTKQTIPLDLVPKIVQLPNNWNLGDIELNFDLAGSDSKNGYQIGSPDEHIEKEWEFV